MPHFELSLEVNTYVKQLLLSFYSGYLWHDKPIYVDVELIIVIIGLPLVGIYLVPYLRKYSDIVISARMKDKYDLIRDNIGFLIASINDHTVWFATNALASKLLCKMWPNQFTMGAVALEESMHREFKSSGRNFCWTITSRCNRVVGKGNAFEYYWLLIWFHLSCVWSHQTTKGCTSSMM